jgi:putative hemolysin
MKGCSNNFEGHCKNRGGEKKTKKRSSAKSEVSKRDKSKNINKRHFLTVVFCHICRLFTTE